MKISSKFVRILVVALTVIGVIIPLAGCATTASTSTPVSQTAKVLRGNLIQDITASGNLALSHTEDVAVQISGTTQDPITVQEVLVNAGDSVKTGDVLAKLDTTALEKKITDQERAVQTAEQALKTAKDALNKAKQDGDYQISSAELDLETATINFNKLNYPFSYSTFAFDVPQATMEIRIAQEQLKNAKAGLAADPNSDAYSTALDLYYLAMQNLSSAQDRLAKGLPLQTTADNTTAISKTVSDYLAARSAKIAMDKAQHSLDQAKDNVDTSISKAQQTLDNANQDLSDAQNTLSEYKDDLTRVTIVAPFDGFVAAVNVTGGAEVKKGNIIATIAEPTKFKADIMVGERDLIHVNEGSYATIQPDAISGLMLPAKVTYISPTATISSGVVNYKVTVEVDSTQSITLRQGTETTSSGQIPSTSSNQTPSAPRQTPSFSGQVPSSNQTSGRQFSGMGGMSFQNSTGASNQATTATQTNELREGMTITVSVIAAQRNNVLLVPKSAITTSSAGSQVTVLNNEVSEKRTVTTGISNWQYTEITSGLNEGETISVPISSGTSNQRQGNVMFVPGVGGAMGGR